MFFDWVSTVNPQTHNRHTNGAEVKQNVPLNRNSVLLFERKLYSCSCFYVVNWKTWNTDGGAAKTKYILRLNSEKLLIVYWLFGDSWSSSAFVCFYFFREKLVWRRIDQEKLRSVISFYSRLTGGETRIIWGMLLIRTDQLMGSLGG